MSQPTSPSISAAGVAKDITVFGGIAVSILTVLANAFPSFGLSAGWQAIVNGVIVVLTSLLAVSKQTAVAKAASKAAAK